MRIRLTILLATLLSFFACTEPEPDLPLIETDENGLAENMFTEWPAYDPVISYKFSDDYPDYEMPTRNLPYTGRNLDWTMHDGWWSFFAGTNANPLVTEEAVQPMLERLNTDFAYIRDVMGWPPDMAVQNGYRSAVFLYGSGLSTDNADNTETGGWQSWVSINNTDWPVILISYYPVYCFDPDCNYNDIEFQTDAVVHEGIHTMFSSMPGRNNKAWFHEGSNCWLQATMELDRSGLTDYSGLKFGWLAAGSMIAPFIPIECYGGWLADGSFGGPNYEGLNDNTRRILGGVQYSEVFPTFLAEYLGYYSIPWIWQNCRGMVLSGMGTVMGEEQMRRLIQEYRARLCLADLGRYEAAVMRMYNDNMGVRIYSEFSTAPAEDWTATPYAATTPDDDGWLIPEERTLPGWTGANIVPLKVEGESVTVTFDAMNNNMSLQLCYRTADGKAVYCDPVTGGDCTIVTRELRPANDVVFAVITNLDYTYSVINQRSLHYSYRLKPGNGVKATADIHTDWFDWTR